MKKSMLLSTIAMIVVVVVALSTATFAWFSATTTPAIKGTATVAATRDFDIRKYDGAWTSTNSIPLTAENVAPVAPMTSLKDTPLITKAGNVDAGYANNGDDYKNWFKVNDAFGDPAYYTNTEVTTTHGIATIATFQVAKFDKLADNTAKVAITIKLGGDPSKFNNDDMTALKAINVVLHIQSYTEGVADQWVGTQYNTATPGLITTPNTAGATLGDASKKAAVPVTTDGLVADGDATLAGLTEVTTNPYYKVTASGENQGIYRQIGAPVEFAANEYKLVTAYIWLDGYDARDNMMSKAFDISIGFNTENQPGGQA